MEKGNELKTTLRLELVPLQELSPASRVRFALLDRQLQVQREGELPLAEVARGTPAARVEAVLHPADTIVTAVTVPPLPAHRLSAAVAGAVEPMLLGDIETLALAHGTRNPDGSVAVAWAPRDLLARAMQVLASHGLSADALLPAPMMLPLVDNAWSAAERDGHLVVRTGPQSGYCWATDPTTAADGIDPAAAGLLLAIEQEEPAALCWFGPVPAWWRSPLDVAEHTRDPGERWRGFAPSWSLALPELQPRNGRRSAWRRPLGWAAAAAAVWLVGLNVHAWQLSREEKVLKQRMNDQVKAAFPDLPVIVDPLKQAEQRRNALRSADGKFGDSDFLPMALAVSQVLPQAASNLKTLTFTDAQLRLELVDDNIGMATPSAATPTPNTPARRQLTLQRTAPANAAPANDQTAGIAPAVVQRAKELGLVVDKADGAWRFRLAGATVPGNQNATRVRIDNGGIAR